MYTLHQKKIPRLEHGIHTRSHEIRHWHKINNTAVIQRGHKKMDRHWPPHAKLIEDPLGVESIPPLSTDWGEIERL